MSCSEANGRKYNFIAWKHPFHGDGGEQWHVTCDSGKEVDERDER